MSFIKENTAMFTLGHLVNEGELSTEQLKLLGELHPRLMKSKLVSEEYDTITAVDEVFEFCIATLEDYLTKEGL